MDILLIAMGIALLFTGGEALIKGALATAQRFNVSPLLTGLVIVGFGTSAPELAVSLDATINGQPDIAVGNVIGSNIGNILLILGICAVISPLSVKPLVLKRDGTAVLLSTLLFILIGGALFSRLAGALFIVLLAAFLIYAYQTESEEPKSEEPKNIRSIGWTISVSIVGLVLLILGSQSLLKGAVNIAEHFQVSEAVIGLTLVAIGTSLPELSISVIAALRRHTDVAIGNVLGSNIFNLLGILGISAVVKPLSINERILQFDQWVLLATTAVLMVFLYTGRKLSRAEASLLLLAYVTYVTLSFSKYG
ncbi:MULTISPECIES: calcium/sodium antiporter [Gammaproteobacteria]|uniref:calcium/sodium antiporter n=1 Tax=Gammaproteobacteria TaxID=1236 RepID=UPI000DD0C7DB|nr:MULTISPECIES: calcium/sodium antiporter [Gammaproteobacteria]RTE87429.1 calcium/sodium antiporter [Aliidiomarina sp. B3213]TCZ92786.1 calcium/sodium antiporter [Lysobacter sp. N42]